MRILAQESGSCGVQDCKINTMFTVVVSVHVPKYIFGQHLYEQADACTAKWKLWRAGLQKENTMFTVVVSVHVPKYISRQHVYEQADACTAKWKLWRAGLQN